MFMECFQQKILFKRSRVNDSSGLDNSDLLLQCKTKKISTTIFQPWTTVLEGALSIVRGLEQDVI